MGSATVLLGLTATASVAALAAVARGVARAPRTVDAATARARRADIRVENKTIAAQLLFGRWGTPSERRPGSGQAVIGEKEHSPPAADPSRSI